MTMKKHPDDLLPSGRPTKYLKKFDKEVFKLCLLGAKDEAIANFFEIDVATLTNWKKSKPSFLASIRAGKEQADNEVAQSLFNLARGYSYDAIELKVTADGGGTSSVEKVKVKKHVPPNDRAIAFWLKNRRPDLWRDKTEVDQTIVIRDYKIGFDEENEASNTNPSKDK